MVDTTVHATPFDAVDDLVDAGFDEPRAKAIVRLVEGRRTDLVTKADLKTGLESLAARLDAQDARFGDRLDAQDARLDARLDAQDARLDAKFSAAVNRMLLAQVGIAGVILGGVAAIVALFQLPT